MNSEQDSKIVSDDEIKTMITEMHLLLTDENVGICKRVKKLDEAIYGNGRIGIKTQQIIMWGLLTILGSESQIVAQITEKIGKWLR